MAYIRVGSGKLAGPVEHVNNLAARIFAARPDVETVEVYHHLDDPEPYAIFTRETDGSVSWWSVVKSRKQSTHKVRVDKASGERRRVRVHQHVHQSPNVGELVRVGKLDYTSAELDKSDDRGSRLSDVQADCAADEFFYE